jgi:hypothetical protein
MKKQETKTNEKKSITFTNLSEVGDKLKGTLTGFIETKFGICIVVDNSAMNMNSDLLKIVKANKEMFKSGNDIEITLIKIVKLKGKKTYKVFEVKIIDEILTSQSSNILNSDDLPF